VTLIGTSIATAVVTGRALRAHRPIAPAPAAKKPPLDGWTTAPVVGERQPLATPPIGGAPTDTTAQSSTTADASSSPAHPPATAAPTSAASETPSGAEPGVDVERPAAGRAPNAIAWIGYALLLVPIWFCVVPGMLLGIYTQTESSGYDHAWAGPATTAASWVFFVAVSVFLRFKGRFGLIGLLIPAVLMAMATAAALVADQPAGPPFVLICTAFVGGLVTLHRRAGVKIVPLVAIGVALPLLAAAEFAAWLFGLVG
ncbi:MAG: hypothetical protein IT379_01765, partial [Deltaproteobacteria bacterium]|nr:hypothetical protein [Deltaproteobacteria bacterium]